MVALLLITTVFLALRCLKLLMDIHLSLLLLNKRAEVVRTGARQKHRDLFVDGWF